MPCGEEKSERIVSYADTGHWVSTATCVLGGAVTTRPQAGLQAVQLREGFKEDFVDLFTFPNISNNGILIIIFI
jgi:hypothetical protein